MSSTETQTISMLNQSLMLLSHAIKIIGNTGFPLGSFARMTPLNVILTRKLKDHFDTSVSKMKGGLNFQNSRGEYSFCAK